MMADHLLGHRRRQAASLLLAVVLVGLLMLKVWSEYRAEHMQAQLSRLEAEQRQLRLIHSRLQLEKYALMSPIELQKLARSSGFFQRPEVRVLSDASVSMSAEISADQEVEQ